MGQVQRRKLGGAGGGFVAVNLNSWRHLEGNLNILTRDDEHQNEASGYKSSENTGDTFRNSLSILLTSGSKFLYGPKADYWARSGHTR